MFTTKSTLLDPLTLMQFSGRECLFLIYMFYMHHKIDGIEAEYWMRWTLRNKYRTRDYDLLEPNPVNL